MPCLDIDTLRRVVFLGSAGYSVSQIKKQNWQTILIEYFLTFQPADWTNAKRLMEIQSSMKDPFSAQNPFSTQNDCTPNNIEWDTAWNCIQAAFQYDNRFKVQLEHIQTILVSSLCISY